ncbi:MAG: sulfatase [Lentisphaerae bacterium]|nr:sulfatase [Lentisphaerota bacterium]MBT5605134.1 sulfatase [Lentisphaerota bacterium]MBT7059854.1 sulfatase [Lentisphaerota bacterium]MBT7840251.1 sulfatase [Lentisphaerota bacterium]
MGDQLRPHALSCFGNRTASTPNLDRMGAAGIATAGCPLCSPFRGSMLTSRYPHDCIPGHDVPMPDGLPTVADAFSRNGYDTAWFGKWHVDGDTNRPKGTRPAFQTVAHGRRGGFRTWLGYENNNAQYDCWLHGHRADGTAVEHYQLEDYETDALTDLLVHYLEDRSDPDETAAEPFFACLSVQPPHGPYVAPPEWLGRHCPEDVELRPNVPPIERITTAARRDLARYYAMVENLDWNVGRVLEALRKAGLADDTVVLFFSDHGDMHGSHGRILKCVPYEESLRMPFIVGTASESFRITPTAPGWTPSLVNHVDLAPTSLGLAGIDAPEWMRGTDYSGYYFDQRPRPKDEPGSAYIQLVDPGWTNRYACDRERPWRGVVTGDGWKYAVLEGQPWLMFNLTEDPFELANLATDGRFSRKRRELQDLLEEWLEETGDSFNLPEIPISG